MGSHSGGCNHRNCWSVDSLSKRSEWDLSLGRSVNDFGKKALAFKKLDSSPNNTPGAVGNGFIVTPLSRGIDFTFRMSCIACCSQCLMGVLEAGMLPGQRQMISKWQWHIKHTLLRVSRQKCWLEGSNVSVVYQKVLENMSKKIHCTKKKSKTASMVPEKII